MFKIYKNVKDLKLCHVVEINGLTDTQMTLQPRFGVHILEMSDTSYKRNYIEICN